MSDSKETKPGKPTDPAIPQALLDHVLANYKKPADLIGENGLLKQLTKAVVEAAKRSHKARGKVSGKALSSGRSKA